jgi:hypothetical protein
VLSQATRKEAPLVAAALSVAVGTSEPACTAGGGRLWGSQRRNGVKVLVRAGEKDDLGVGEEKRAERRRRDPVQRRAVRHAGREWGGEARAAATAAAKIGRDVAVGLELGLPGRVRTMVLTI